MSSIYKPGYLEAIFGPMKSGKSEFLIRKFDEISNSNIEFVLFKPAIDTREKGIMSRASNKELEAVAINENKPEEILSYLENSDCQIIGIDEANFFSDSLVEIVITLIEMNYHVIVSGLLLSFRGEPFGPMPYLVGRADNVIRLKAVCEYPNCNQWALLTQRLIDGKPASYDSPLILVEHSGQNEKYEARCVKHHIVPRETQKS